MDDSRRVIDGKVDELLEMLREASGYERIVTRPIVVVGCKAAESGQLVAVHGPGPVTIVTFMISHSPDDERQKEMIQKAKQDAS
jgi:hypothetical protein